MDIESLETFIKTAELLHFGRASRACNLSPSALTRTIQRLEDEVGQPLFLRDNRSVSLTAEGNRLLAYARGAVHDWSTFRDGLDEDRQLSGTLSIYASVTAVYSLLPNLLETYRSKFPEVQIGLRTGAAERAIEQVLSGEIDLAVAALPDQKLARLEFMPLAETPLVFIAPKAVDGNKARPFKGSDPLVIPQSGTARRRLDSWYKKNHMTAHVASEVSGNEALIAMVRLGVGVGIVPLLALERSPLRDEIDVLERAPLLDPYVVGLCSSKRNLKRPAAREMWTLAASLGPENRG